MLADGKTIVCFGSTATSPAMPVSTSPDKGREMIAANALPKDFPSDATGRAADRHVSKAKMGWKSTASFLSRADARSPGPALIFAHGGPPRQMMPGFHYMYYYHNAYARISIWRARVTWCSRSIIVWARCTDAPSVSRPTAGWRGSAEYKDVVAGAQVSARAAVC